LRASGIAALLATLLFAPGVWWGLPYATDPARERGWAVDDETPLGVLSEVRRTVLRQGHGNPGYPLFYSFASAAVYAPYLGYLALTGGFTKSDLGYHPGGLAEPARDIRRLALLSKCLSVLFGAIVVVGALQFGRVGWDATTGALGAAFVALIFPLAYYARTGNVDVPMLGMVALALIAYARIVTHGLTAKRAVALGVFAGLAVATKDSALGVFLAVPLAIPFIRQGAVTGSIRTGWRHWMLAAGAAFVSLGIGSGLFVDPEKYFDHLRFLTGRVGMLPGAAMFSASFPMTLAGHRAYLGFLGEGLVNMLTLPGLILSIVGIVLSLKERPRSLLLLLPAVTYLLFLFVLLRFGQLRYLLPVGFVLGIFAAVGVVTGMRMKNRMLRGAALALGIGALSIGLLRYVDLTHAMIRDSRYAAARWLASQLQPGDTIEFFGASQKLPNLPDGISIRRATEWRGMFASYDTSAAKVAAIVAGWEARRPRMILVMPDHSTRSPGLPYDATVPPALFRALEAGQLAYHRVARFQSEPLIPWVRTPRLDYPMVNPPIHVYAR
jgi:4-amino-4-deoxy-L-arabinose transferase-like glycosyltransferase